MDINLRIIEAVSKMPCLYTSSQIEERNKQWKRIAKELDIEEQTLKLRWHSILKRYHSEKLPTLYVDRLQFMKRNSHIRRDNKWPEFEITADTTEEQKNCEEYVFLEVDEIESQTTISKYSGVKNDKRNPIVTGNDISSVCIPDNGNKNNKTNGNNKCNDNANKENFSVVPTDDSSKQACLGSSVVIKANPEKNTESITSPSERCEDVIFGELVTAMLKRMSEDKKRNIKKEIMNLLLS
ncbi:uncharacterized protein LOC142237805 isoform X1 [Haematobia irritans]|uniref:uncharacterized protein LOC142237805 isoform X1 n=1 Tax=Haematobia irritans TaxID=7368 RepID=UPI003F509210